MSKLFDPDVQTVLWLALDLDGEIAGDAEELMVTMASSLAIYALWHASLRVGLVASGALAIHLAADYGREQQQRLQEILAEAHAGSAIALTRQLGVLDRQIGPGQTMMLFTTLICGKDGSTARRGIATRVIHVADRAWTVPVVRLSLALADPVQQAQLINALEGSAMWQTNIVG